MATRRQQLAELLRGQRWRFDELCRELELSARELEAELGHLARSLRRGGVRIAIEPPRCRACERELPSERRPFHTPSRCHRCRAERVEPPSFFIED